MSAVDKSIARHKRKLERKKKNVKEVFVNSGCGMGWPEGKDSGSRADYIAQRLQTDPEYSPNHDGRLYMIV
jgi:hypothetical protein